MPVNRVVGWACALLLTLGGSRQSDSDRTVSASILPDAASSHSSLVRLELPASPEVRDPIGLRVVYPSPTDIVRVKDSSFLFGSVASRDTRLTINGVPVRVWPNGAWLAWLPFPADTLMQFRIEARTPSDTSVLIYPVRRDRSSL
ncbi:MAG TPA: hypothetical protein VFU40_11060, partial [Gemmatimonadales bacterium]|nr:hypothetical protein [Gemmatimonadales bacterium]